MNQNIPPTTFPPGSDPPRGDAPRRRFDPREFTQPDPALLRYYFINAIFSLIFFPITYTLSYLYFKSIRYEFDEDGVSMKSGVLTRKETNLTYRRIQDIHVVTNIIERWLGIAKVAVQTASGSAGPEMVILGVRDPEALRDYLYARMRGARDDDNNISDDHDHDHGRDRDRADLGISAGPAGHPAYNDAAPVNPNEVDPDEVLTLLREIRDALADTAATDRDADRQEGVG